MSTSRTRLVLADDDVLLREGPAGPLGRSGFEVAGKAGAPSELIELVRKVRPDLATVLCANRSAESPSCWMRFHDAGRLAVDSNTCLAACDTGRI